MVERHRHRSRLSSLVAIGALPLAAALAGTGTAAADTPPPSGTSLAAPGHPALQNTVDPFTALLMPAPDSAAMPAATEPTVAPGYVGRNSPAGVRAEPHGQGVAPVDPAKLRLPDPAALAAPVAPIAPPEGKLRAGDTQVDIPQWLTPEQADLANDAAATAEAQLARVLDTAGFEPTRSDLIAARSVGAAAVGGAIGAGVISPVAVAGGFMGGFVGAMAGMPFAPAGLVFGPVAGATAAVALITAPAVAVGAATGAVLGGVEGYLAPAVAETTADEGGAQQ